VAKFSEDDLWYRAKITHLQPGGLVTVVYVDYGNSEAVPLSSVCKLLQCFLALPPQVHNSSHRLDFVSR